MKNTKNIYFWIRDKRDLSFFANETKKTLESINWRKNNMSQASKNWRNSLGTDNKLSHSCTHSQLGHCGIICSLIATHAKNISVGLWWKTSVPQNCLQYSIVTANDRYRWCDFKGRCDSSCTFSNKDTLRSQCIVYLIILLFGTK